MPENEPTYLQRRDFPNLVRERRVRYSYVIEEEKSSEDQSRDRGYSSN